MPSSLLEILVDGSFSLRKDNFESLPDKSAACCALTLIQQVTTSGVADLKTRPFVAYCVALNQLPSYIERDIDLNTSVWLDHVWSDLVWCARKGLQEDRFEASKADLFYFLARGLSLLGEHHQAARVFETALHRITDIPEQRRAAALGLFGLTSTYVLSERVDVLTALIDRLKPPIGSAKILDIWRGEVRQFVRSLPFSPTDGGDESAETLAQLYRRVDVAEIQLHMMLLDLGVKIPITPVPSGAAGVLDALDIRGQIEVSLSLAALQGVPEYKKIIEQPNSTFADVLNESFEGLVGQIKNPALLGEICVAQGALALATGDDSNAAKYLLDARNNFKKSAGDFPLRWKYVMKLNSDEESLRKSISTLDSPARRLVSLCLAPPRSELDAFFVHGSQPGRIEKGSKPHALVCLRRWSSAAAVFDAHKNLLGHFGGGFFLYGGPGRGIVVDPGRDFVRLMCISTPYVFSDISHIVITHDHDDHSADLTRLFTIGHEVWRGRPKIVGSGSRFTLILGPQVEGIATELFWEYQHCESWGSDTKAEPDERCNFCKEKFARNGFQTRLVKRQSGEIPFCAIRRPYLRCVVQLAPSTFDAIDELTNIKDDQRIKETIRTYEDSDSSVRFSAIPARHNGVPILEKNVFFAMGVRVEFGDTSGVSRTFTFTGDTGLSGQKDRDAYLKEIKGSDVLIMNTSTVKLPSLLGDTEFGDRHLGLEGTRFLLENADYQVAVVQEFIQHLSRFDWRRDLLELLQKVLPRGRTVLLGEIGLMLGIGSLDVRCTPLCGDVEERQMDRLGFVPTSEVEQMKLYAPASRAEGLTIVCPQCRKEVTDG